MKYSMKAVLLPNNDFAKILGTRTPALFETQRAAEDWVGLACNPDRVADGSVRIIDVQVELVRG